MKRLFAPRKGKEEEQPANTLDRLVRDKEGVRKRLEEEERGFLERRREYISSLIQFEKKEVARRERELEEKKTDLADKKRLNLEVQDKFVEQMKMLQLKLEEVREEHARRESTLEADIAGLEEKLTEVRSSLEARLAEIPSAPDSELETQEPTSLYPDLSYSMARSISMHKIGTDRNQLQKYCASSTGSSPQISIASTVSASSATGNKRDSDMSV